MRYTRIHEFLYDWEPFYNLSIEARYVWFALYTGPTAKLYPPGILRANISGFAEECRMGTVDLTNAIREMVDKETIEHDLQRRVVMLRTLPDRGERPSSAKNITALWNRWLTLPECELKYKYLHLMEWLVDRFPTANYLKAWNETFGAALEQAYDASSDLVSPTTEGPTYPQGEFLSSTDGGKIREKGTCQDETDRKPQPVDNLRTARQTSMFSTPVDEASHDPSYASSHEASYASRYSVTGNRYSESGSPDRGRARQVGTPSAQPFTVAELLDAVGPGSGGRVVVAPLDERTGEALWELVDRCGDQGVSLDDAKLVGRHLAAGHVGYRTDLDAQWLTRSGVFLGLVGHARKWSEDGERKIRPTGGQARDDDRGMSARDVADRAKRLEEQGL